ncbi:hypothetical protein Ahu01nite_011730 [Winogradskya humida]|uniref:Uncharacterized protein n=1 Tax=Winogradskya humida TaxID=113566 RepID=A0ABQ3ZHL6_9ACTN|nr:hypothetical protein Ahu01nite_011730 [Actinoplanes humidus]
MIGYWDGPGVEDELPDVCGFVHAGVDLDVQRAVAAYLRSGTCFVATAGWSVCRLCGAANGTTELTDGKHFVWPEGLAHYVEEHGVVLPEEVVAVALRGPAAVVADDLLESGDVEIDAAWWRGEGGAAARHFPGCRRSGTTDAWNLPAVADIYVDGVPPGSVAVLGRLRELLGAAWPYSGLRDLLGAQPVLAVAAGAPKELDRALVAYPELRPYLFYGTEGGLMPFASLSS